MEGRRALSGETAVRPSRPFCRGVGLRVPSRRPVPAPEAVGATAGVGGAPVCQVACHALAARLYYKTKKQKYLFFFATRHFTDVPRKTIKLSLDGGVRRLLHQSFSLRETVVDLREKPLEDGLDELDPYQRPEVAVELLCRPLPVQPQSRQHVLPLV